MFVKHLGKSATTILLAGVASSTFGHGLITTPSARNDFCGLIEKPDTATTQACIDAFANDFSGGYQFMSVLTHDIGRKGGRSNNVCGFDSETWQGGETPWDQAVDWPVNVISSGNYTFTWNISWGPHYDDTEEFVYYITREDFEFQVGVPLTWDDFEETPFCDLGYVDATPNANPLVVPDKAASLFHTTCVIPERSGRHVIYGEWGRNRYTYERFHSCMDVVFDGQPPIATPTPETVPTPTPPPVETTPTPVGPTPAPTPEPTPDPAVGGSCNWWGSSMPLCQNQTSGWGWENQQSCVSIETCLTAPGNEGLATTASPTPEVAPTATPTPTITPTPITPAPSVTPTPVVTPTPNVTPTPIVLPTPDTNPEQGATCEHVVSNAWATGFQGAIRIINKGSEPIYGWEVNWSYTDGSTVHNVWNANFVDAQPYTASHLGWNSTIQPGETVEFGFTGNGGGQATSVTGETCQ